MKHERGSKRKGKTNKFFGKMMALDKFSYSVPQFNFKGDQSIKTGLGAFCSITITIIVLYYALLKFIQLIEHQNPTIATFPAVGIRYDSENPLNLNKINFKAAFRFSGLNYWWYYEIKDDPQYVKMIVSLSGMGVDGKPIERIIPHHKCTPEEYAEFYPIVNSMEEQLTHFKADGGFYCIDWDENDPYLVFGDQNKVDIWSNLNVRLVPCNFIGPFNHTVTQNCDPNIQN